MARVLAAAARLSLAASLACAPALQVHQDAVYDWRGASSWDWQPLREEPPAESDSALRQQIGGAIQRELAARGLVRSRSPDLLVAASFALAREQVTRNETPAQQFLPSFHAGSPSYEIVASRRHIIVYERVVLAIEVFDAESRQLVWRGVHEERCRGSFSARAERAVAAILSRLPVRPAPVLRDPTWVASAAPGPGKRP
jgi:hypothetical protein